MNKSIVDRVLKAYRPLYLQGLLLDGQYRLPPTAAQGAKRRRMLLAALTGLRHVLSTNRSQR